MSFTKRSMNRRKQNLSGGEGERFLVFNLQKESYAIPITRIKECIALTGITSVPNTPAHFKGVINLRGQMVSIVDLRLRLRMSKAENNGRTPIVILDIPDVSVGVIIDSIERVIAATPREIQPPPNVETTVSIEYITGTIRKGERMIFILDVEQAAAADVLRERAKLTPTRAA
jgi:purine-binding chemotaxis protein CheW